MNRLYQKYVCKVLLTFIVSMMVFTVQAQNIQISGLVTDASGIGIPSASVMVKSSKNGTATNEAGRYVISAKKGDILTFSSTGFTSQQVEVGIKTTINIKLQEDAKGLEEIVVVGY